MKIAVLGGSPKGEVSVTMQYVRYIRQEIPRHEFTVLQAAKPIGKLERDRDAFHRLIQEIRSADAVLWAFPLYYFTVCSQFQRFIELIWERGVEDAFCGKHAASLSTSIHFYDNAAHEYIRAISEDLEMEYVGAFSAGMRDLMGRQGRESLLLFARDFLQAAEEGTPMPRAYAPVRWEAPDYRPEIGLEADLRTGRRIAVVTDSRGGNVGKMIDKVQSLFAGPVRVVDLSEVDIKGGCLGCLKCSHDNVCAYAGRDGFTEMFNGLVEEADILLFAGAIRRRHLSSEWKRFFDRSFFRTHQPYFPGKQLGFLISGPLAQNANLRQILTAYTEMHQAQLLGFVTDEAGDSAQIDRQIEGMAERMVRFAEAGYRSPATFLGIAGRKVFRDDIYGQLRVVFKADHRFYRRHGLYDFPQKRTLQRIFVTVMYWITSIPAVRKAMLSRFRRFMIMPYRRLFSGA